MRFRRRKPRALAPVSPVVDELPARRRKAIYLLPNAFTLFALFAGFFAIVQAMNQRFEWAAIAIFAAMVLDGMDGRVARLTHTQSAFGEQFDSLSDMTSFGVAPALVMYEWILTDLGRWGWAAAFIYCAGAALRLARFNANLGVVDKRFFQGLPSPAAAALIAGFVWLAIDNKFQIRDAWMPWVAFGMTVYAGLTMVSSAPFFSGKFRRRSQRAVLGAGGADRRALLHHERPADHAVRAVLLLRAVGLRLPGMGMVARQAESGPSGAADSRLQRSLTRALRDDPEAGSGGRPGSGRRLRLYCRPSRRGLPSTLAC